MSERLSYVRRVVGKDLPSVNPDRKSIIYALIMCLSPEDACEALDVSFEQAYPERNAVVRKLAADIGSELRPCHVALFETLVSSLGSLPSRRRPSAAGTLLDLASALGDDYWKSAIERVCLSEQATVRRRAFTRIRHLDDTLPVCVGAAFDRFGDIESARLLASKGTVSEVRYRQPRLEECLRREHFFLARLFTTLGASDPGSLERLRNLNPVTHAYVCAKLGRALDPDYMVQLYADRMFSQESGLVAWCCGQMGLWDALVEIEALAATVPDEALTRYFAGA